MYLCKCKRSNIKDMKTRYLNNVDLFNADCFLVNGIIVNFFDAGIQPTIKDVVTNFNYIVCGVQLEDAEIQNIINMVAKYYN